MASMISAGAASLEAGRNHQERSLTRSLTHIGTTGGGPTVLYYFPARLGRAEGKIEASGGALHVRSLTQPPAAR